MLRSSLKIPHKNRLNPVIDSEFLCGIFKLVAETDSEFSAIFMRENSNVLRQRNLPRNSLEDFIVRSDFQSALNCLRNFFGASFVVLWNFHIHVNEDFPRHFSSLLVSGLLPAFF